MKTFLVIFQTHTGMNHLLTIQAKDIPEAYKIVLNYPTLSEILQITLMS